MVYNTLSPEETFSYDLKLKETEIAWIAGLLEGEAAFGNDKRIRRNDKVSYPPPTPFINLRMSDEDVVRKFANYVKKNVFQVKIKKSLAKNPKPIYSCYVGDRATMYYLVNKIVPYMGNRRKKELQQQLQYIEEWKEWYDAGGRSRTQFNLLKKQTEYIEKMENPAQDILEEQDPEL